LEQITSPKSSQSRTLFWFSLSLSIAALYGILALQQAFSGEYVVQDDARQHVFWMQRFLDPQLFPNDLIADYFQSVAPEGYTAFYWIFAKLGIDPMVLAKLLPIGLGLIAAAYGFAISLQLMPVPLTAFLSTLLLEQVLWTHDDLASATPRAFMPPLFLAFLYYLMRRKLWPCLVTIALEGLFYPQYVFVFAGMLVLQPVGWQAGKLRLSQDRKEYGWCAAGLFVAFLVLLPFALTTSDYGPTITAAEARSLQEFNAGGRSRFFYDNFWYFWFAGNRSGLFPAFRPATIAIGLLFPLLLRFPERFPLTRQISRQIRILPQMILTALTLFFIAHAVLFKLHLPSRYSAYTLRFVLVFATAIGLSLLLDAGLRWVRRLERHRQGRSTLLPRLGVWGAASLLGLALLVYPNTMRHFPKTNYESGSTPALYQFFAQQPQDSLIASVLKEADDLPSFTGRSILVGREYAIPYHVGYANQFRQRVTDLIRAQYSLDASDLVNFIRTYDIHFWLLNRDIFNTEVMQDSWIEQYPDVLDEALDHVEQGTPILKKMLNRCDVFRDPESNLIVLQTSCILRKVASQ
jgi:hypothetical protein